MIGHLLNTVGTHVAGMVAERIIQATVERFLSTDRSTLDLRVVPRAQAVEYARAHPGAMDGAAFALAALKYVVDHPAHMPGVFAALTELGLARIENPGCVIFVNNPIQS